MNNVLRIGFFKPTSRCCLTAIYLIAWKQLVNNRQNWAFLLHTFWSIIITWFSVHNSACLRIIYKILILNRVNNSVNLFKGIGEFNFFFTKNNVGSYMKAISINYKPVFIELKISNYFWNIVFLVKSFRYKRIDCKFFRVNFLGNLKNLFYSSFFELKTSKFQEMFFLKFERILMMWFKKY